MRTFEEYMKLPYKLEIIPDTEESGFVASYPELPGCITCGETVAEVVANAEDAKRAWLAAAIEDGIEIAEPETADSYSGQFKLRLPKTLHKTLAEDSKKEGVSMNQYCVYLLAKNSEKEHISISKKQTVLVYQSFNADSGSSPLRYNPLFWQRPLLGALFGEEK